jgi:uncharacterized damage-inducible protein DinB
MTADAFANTVGAQAALEMANALLRIKHCLNQLSDEQIWWRAAPSLNSIGNLILHLCGNVRQWIIVGLGGGHDTRNRPAEFAEQGPMPRAELLQRLDAVVEEAGSVLRRQQAEQMLRVRRIQGMDVTGLEALFSCVPHFRGHTQEITAMTRLQLREAYRFAWTPASAEQGA